MSQTSSSAAASRFIGFVGLVTILFIGLKLTRVIWWSWWSALSPLLFAWGIILLVITLFLAWAFKKGWRP